MEIHSSEFATMVRRHIDTFKNTVFKELELFKETKRSQEEYDWSQRMTY
jgi:hypothetical protein